MMGQRQSATTSNPNLQKHVSLFEVYMAHLAAMCADSRIFLYPQTAATDGDSIRTFEAGFRGRCMRGCELNLPEGYSGVVLERRHQKSDEISTHSWQAVGTFDAFSYWNHDRHPVNSDGIQRVMEWAALASAIHKPLEPEGCCDLNTANGASC